jgi:predicted RNA-binding Zn-ribbon protein involved in translation (DUF1610 family)
MSRAVVNHCADCRRPIVSQRRFAVVRCADCGAKKEARESAARAARRRLRTQAQPAQPPPPPAFLQPLALLAGRPSNVFEAIMLQGHDEDWQPGEDAKPEPCRAPPGSAEKIEILAGRVREGRELWHAEDASYA